MKIHAFYGGPFSQWQECRFVADEIEYNRAEQYMMAQKARLFGDSDAHDEIMESEDPATQKRWGRAVRGFDAQRWAVVANDIVWRGNFEKFTQNRALREELFATRGHVLVEASPYDTVWGVGLALNDPDLQDPTKWRGQNRLGWILTGLRRGLLCEPY